MAGSGVTLYANNAAGNKAIVGTIDWRENVYMPSQINDNVAQIMADIRAMANSVANGWIEIGDTDGTYTAVYNGANSLQFAGVDVTAYYRPGIRIRVVAPTPGALSGTILTSVFATHTTLTIAWDSGGLSNETITAVQIGVGSGDTAIVGTRHDCRLDYVSGGVIRLNRYGGKQITIDNGLRTIPAAGVDLVFNGGIASSGQFVYANMSGSAIALVIDPAAPVLDTRDGNMVHPVNFGWTVVGAAIYGLGGFFQSATIAGVASYWNRVGRRISSTLAPASTASAARVAIAGELIYTCFEDPIITTYAGYSVNTGASVYQLTEFMHNGVPAIQQYSHSLAVGAYMNPSMAASFVAVNGGINRMQLMGSVGGGTGTWYGINDVTVRG